jgi:hypothetical protein
MPTNEMRLDSSLRRQINWLPGDRVRLFPDTGHEGMHPDDEYAPPPPVVTIVAVDRHAANVAWVVGFDVRDDEGEDRYIPIGAVHAFVYPDPRLQPGVPCGGAGGHGEGFACDECRPDLEWTS